MTSQPPPDGSPTGPPSGPLSGPSSGPSPGPSAEPPSGAPSGPAEEPTQAVSGTWRGGGDESGGPGGPGGGGSGDGDGDGEGGDGGGKPWWRSSPRVALITAVLVGAVALVVYLTRPDGGAGSGEVFLEPVASEGRDPFTKSTAKETTAPASPTPTPTAAPDDTRGTASVSGSAPGLYGGSRSTPSCDVEKQIDFLQREPAKAKAFADVEGIKQGELPSYLRSLTPLQLRADTRVTNHGFRDGKATSFQSVLQAGTAVLVDSRGVPRVRCACGNPLLPPVAVETTPKPVGKPWPAYQPSKVVVVQQATTVVNVFVLVDLDTGDWFKRDTGDANGNTDTPTTPPPTESPSPTSPSPATETPPTSESPDTATPESPSPPQEEPESPSPPEEEPGIPSEPSLPGA